MSTDLATYIRAFECTWQGLIEVCERLTDAQWAGPTDLPGWSVQDNVSHIVAEEAYQLGDPMPEHVLASDLAHVKSDFAREIELPIDFRRSHPGTAVLAELRDVTSRRLDVLRGFRDEQLDQEVEFAGRVMPLRSALGIRAFDCWIHEQDVRRAVGAPGGLEDPGAVLTQARLLRALSRVAQEVPAASGRTVVLATSGPNAADAVLCSGAGPSGAAPDVRITMPFETFVRLATGRVAYDAVAGEVSFEGDAALGAELCRHFAVTP